MSLLKTIPHETAEGEVKEIYDRFMEQIGTIPKPFELLSISPSLMAIQEKSMAYFMSHTTLGFPLLSHIRYLVAQHQNYAYCTDFNKKLLKMQGLEDDEVEALTNAPEKTMLEEKDKAMLLFVIKAIKTPEATTENDIKALHALEWTDKDIFDALSHGAGMVTHSIMMKALQMDTCEA